MPSCIFLAYHSIVPILAGAAFVVVQSVDAVCKKQTRPSVSIYVAWVQGLLDYQKVGVDTRDRAAVLPATEPEQMEVPGTTLASLTLLAPQN